MHCLSLSSSDQKTNLWWCDVLSANQGTLYVIIAKIKETQLKAIICKCDKVGSGSCYGSYMEILKETKEMYDVETSTS